MAPQGISLEENDHAWRRKHAFDEQTLVYIMERFHLPLSHLQGSFLANGCYSRHSLSELAGIASDSHLGFIQGPPVRTLDDHDLTFTWNAKTRVTNGILRAINKETRDLLVKGILSFRTLASNPVALGVVFLEHHGIYNRFVLLDSHERIAKIQKTTGHIGALNSNSSDENSQDPPDFGSLSLELSKLSQSISVMKLFSKSDICLSDFLFESMDHMENMVMQDSTSSSASQLPNTSFQTTNQILRDHVRFWTSKLNHSINYWDFYKEVCLVQNQTVYNLIAQRDIQQNIELAKDSKSIAAASKRDSSAMTSISFLTMVVLPGTFISSLFAVPLFNWDASSWRNIAKPRFWFYWAITIPLTVLVLISWFIFQRAWSRRGVEIDKKARDTAGVLLKAGGEEEVLQLEEKKWLRGNWKFPVRKRHNGTEA